MIVQDDPHIPNWETRDGLLSLIALGNVIVFANALEPPTEWEYKPAIMLEWLTARDTYALAVAQFQKYYLIEGHINIFLESAKRFAASIWDYLNKVEVDVKESPEAAAAHRDHVKEVLGEALHFDWAKDILEWEVEEDYFKDTNLLAKNEDERTLLWEPDFQIMRKE